jgi:hypothetical protein
MKRFFLLLVMIGCALATRAQDANTPASFPGGDSAWNRYLDTAFNNKNMVSQMTAKDYERFGKTQRVVYTFNILTDGSIGLINIEGQISQAVRNEVNRVLKNCPRWSPATVGGKPSTYRKRQVSTFTFEE